MSPTTPGANPRGKKSERPGNGPGGGRFRFGSPIAYVLLLLLGFFLFRSVFSEAGVQKVPYSRFLEAVRSDKFSRVVVSNDWVKGYLAAPAEPTNRANNPAPRDGVSRLPWLANRIPQDQELVRLLDSKNVEYEAQPSSAFSDLLWILAAPHRPGPLVLELHGPADGREHGAGPTGDHDLRQDARADSLRV